MKERNNKKNIKYFYENDTVKMIIIVLFFVLFAAFFISFDQDEKEKTERKNIRYFDNFVGNKYEDIIKVFGIGNKENIKENIFILKYNHKNYSYNKNIKITDMSGEKVILFNNYNILCFVIKNNYCESWQLYE